MQPTEGAHPGVTPGQDVLEKAGHELQGLERDRGVSAGVALAIVPAHLALSQELDLAIGGGGLEDVTGEVTQRVLTGSRGSAVHVPMALPHLGRHLREELRMLLLEAGFEQRA